MNESGRPRHRRPLRRTIVTILLASASIPANAATSGSAAESSSGASGAQQSASDPSQQEIVITAPPLFRGIMPERSLDQEAIQSYGISTIDELVGQIEIELGESQDPIIYVNGQRLNDLSEIGALPVEALRNLQVLPRGSAVRAGGRAGQRVINITLKPTVRSATVTAAHKIATEGHWNAERGEAILTRVQGQTRANVALRVRDETSLLESDRHIVQPASAVPYALAGNVVGYPSTSGEVDAMLSSLAGQTVTVAGIPAVANPTLGDFAANANSPATTDIGEFRTLRPKVRNYDLNGTFATRLAPWLTGNATVELVRNLNRFERGLPVASFLLAPTNPASPFSQDVQLAYYADRPLIFRTREDSGDANLTLDANWGAWSADLNARHTEIRDKSFSDRQTAFGGALGDSTNPFAIDIASLIPIRTDVASSRSINDAGVLLVTGPVLTLPSGDLQATVEGRLARNHFVSHSSFSTTDNADIRRGEQALRGQLVVPLTSRQDHFLDAIGDLSASVEYSRVHDSDEGTLSNHSFGLTWDPGDFLHVEGEVAQSQLPPSLGILGDPTVIAPDVRIFDPLTGQTVDVTEIFGGNPGLRPETDKVRRVSAIVRLVPRLNLQANAEYSDTDRRNFIS